MKHIWVVTAWFPSKIDPLQATFVQEQVEIMNVYGKGQFKFSVLNPLPPIDLPNKILRRKTTFTDDWEYSNPIIKVYQDQGVILTHRMPSLVPKGNANLLTRMVKKILLERGKPDAIWAVTLSGAFVTLQVMKELGFSIPFFLQEHSIPLSMHLKKKWQKKMLLNLQKLQFPIIVVAERQIQEFRKYGFEQKVHVISNPVNQIFFDNNCAEAEDESNTKIIVSTGRLTEQKNPLLQVKSAKILALDNFNFKWYWLGGGELENEMKLAIREANLCKFFFLIGQSDRNTISQYLQKASLFIMTSIYENCPVALLEAQVVGVPSVIIKNGASEKVLLPGNGVVVEKDDDADSLVSGIKKALRMNFYRPEIKERANAFFHPRVFFNKMEAFI